MNSKRNVSLLYAVALLHGMIFYGPIATLYRQAAGITVFQITVIESISMALCVLLEVPCGIIADKIGYRRMIIFCCGLYFVSKLVFWKAAGFPAFLLERIMLSVVTAGLSGVDISLLYLSAGRQQAQQVFGVYHSLSMAGLIFASAVYSLLVRGNYRLAGFLTVLSYGAAALVSLFLQEVKQAAQRENSPAEFASGIGELLKNKYLFLFLIAVALLNETHQTITVFLNQLQYVKCGLSDRAIGCLYIAVTVSGLAGGFSARLTQRLGTMRFAGMLFSACIAACMTLAVTGGALLSALSVILLRVAFSLFQPLQADLQNRQITASNRATALSVNAMLIDGVAIATNVMFGRLAEIRLSYAMTLGACFCVAGLLFFSVWYQQYWSVTPRRTKQAASER